MDVGGVLTATVDLGSRGFGTVHFGASLVMGRPDIRKLVMQNEADEQAQDILQELGADELARLAGVVMDRLRKSP